MGWIIDIRDHGRHIIDKLRPQPEPKMHRNAEHFDKAVVKRYRDRNNNNRWTYWIDESKWGPPPGKDVDNDGKINFCGIDEITFNLWKYNALQHCYSKDIHYFESQITVYEHEIEEIEKYIAKEKSENKRKDLNRDIILRERRNIQKDIRMRLASGSTENHTDIIELRKRLQKLDGDLAKIQLNPNYYIALWYDEPESILRKQTRAAGKPMPAKKRQDLYALIYKHKKQIRFIKSHDLKNAERELKRSQFHYRKWRRK